MKRFTATLAACAALAWLGVAAAAPARADAASDYVRALRTAAADLRSAATATFGRTLQGTPSTATFGRMLHGTPSTATFGRTQQGTPATATFGRTLQGIHLPPAPLPGPPRFSPSLDDWLQAQLGHARKARPQVRAKELRRIAATLDFIANQSSDRSSSNPRVDATRMARAILSNPAYQLKELPNKPLPKSWWQRFIEWLGGILDRIFGGIVKAATRVPSVSEGLVIALFAVIAVALAFIIYQLVRGYVLARRPRRADEIGEIIGPALHPNALYAAAREAARAAQYARAIGLLFQASLVALDLGGIVSFDPARTAGEYRRVVRRTRATASSTFDRLANKFTYAAYAERPAGEVDWREAEGAFREMEPLARAGDVT